MRHRARLIATLVCLATVMGSQSFGQVTSSDQLLEQASGRGREQAQAIEQSLWTQSVTRRFESVIEETATLFAQLEKRHSSLVEWMDSLLHSEDGKRIAMKSEAGMQFLRYQEQPVFRLSDFGPKKLLLDDLQRFLAERRQAAPTGYVPQVERIEQANAMYIWARERLARVAEIEAWLKYTLASADLDADVTSAPTLKQRIDSYLATRHQMWVDGIVAGRAAADAEITPRIAENARIVELERALLEAERFMKEALQQLEKERIDFERRLRERDISLMEQVAAAEQEFEERLAAIVRSDKIADAERARRDIDANIEARGIAEEAKAIDLVARCRSATVQRDLRPFLANGIWQPGDRQPNHRFDEGPMSYRSLLEFGALNPDVRGLEMLLGVANARGNTRANHSLHGMRSGGGHPDKTRPKWGYSESYDKLNQEQVAEVLRIQRLLIELGPTLVEEGMLAP